MTRSLSKTTHMKPIIAAAASLLLVLSAQHATAAPLGLDSGAFGEITGSWQVSQGCGGCGPTDTLELFITQDTGAGPFEAPGLDTFTSNPGWSANVINPTYVLATGPSGNMAAWTEHYFGNIADSVTLNLLMWSGGVGGSITFTAAYTRAGNGATNLHCQQFGAFAGCAQFEPNAWNRGPAAVPEPTTLTLLGSGGIAALLRARRRRKNPLA